MQHWRIQSDDDITFPSAVFLAPINKVVQTGCMTAGDELHYIVSYPMVSAAVVLCST